jgi:hypothetical protein
MSSDVSISRLPQLPSHADTAVLTLRMTYVGLYSKDEPYIDKGEVHRVFGCDLHTTSLLGNIWQFRWSF